MPSCPTFEGDDESHVVQGLARRRENDGSGRQTRGRHAYLTSV